jgi:radical SAM protein with 4Fe4S-binding SPASM domain
LTLEKYKELIKNGINGFTISQYSKEIPKNLPPILEYDEKNGHYITFRKFTEDIRENVGGEIEGNILEKPRCSYPDHPIIINSKGRVVLCCNDYHSSIVWGDLKKEKLADIFNKKEFKKFRDNAKKRIFLFPVCKRCRGINN